MKYITVLGVLIFAMAVSALGSIIDPNVGFCAQPATATTCSGQPETNPLGGSTFGMWSFGANNSGNTWYMFVAVPQTSYAAITATPTITSGSFTLTYTAQAEFTSTSGGSIYDLFGKTANASMNWANMSGYDAKLFPGLNDFVVLEYTVTPGFKGNTAYSFSVSPSLIQGTYVAAEGLSTNGNIQFSTPFTTTGLVGPQQVPDGGMTLMLLGGALVGLETLRRKFRV